MSLAEFVRPSIPMSASPARPDRPTVKRWTVGEYDALIATGLLDRQRLELIDGMLIEKFTETGPRPKRWTVEEYDALVATGLLDRKHVELAYGELIEMAPMGDRHAMGIKLGTYALIRAFPPDVATVQVQCPMRISASSAPEPDLAVIAGPPARQGAHPQTALLIVEIADTSLPYDRKVKGSIYAEAGVADYWIVNVIEDCVEVYRDPQRDPADGTFRYGPPVRYGRAESISPLARPDAVVPVNSLLP
jgi:Uma2 family endonuclease